MRTRYPRPAADSTAGDRPPSVAEVAALTSRLRRLTGPAVDPAERAAFLADKAALLARITDQHHPQ